LLALVNLENLTMSTAKSVPNAGEIENKSKEIVMAIERYLNEKQSICNKNCTDSNHGECYLSDAAALVSGIYKCLSGWKRGDFSEGDERKKSEMLGCNLQTVILPCFFQSQIYKWKLFVQSLSLM